MALTSIQQVSTRQPDAVVSRRLWSRLVRPAHFRAVHDFRVAAESGDATVLASLLAPDVAVVVVAGEADDQMTRVVRGVSDSVALLMHGITAQPDVALVELPVNGQSGLTLNRGGEVIAAMTIDFSAGLISMVWIKLHPVMLRHWNQI